MESNEQHLHYIRFKHNKPYSYTEEIIDGLVYIDYDEDGVAIGIEVLDGKCTTVAIFPNG